MCHLYVLRRLERAGKICAAKLAILNRDNVNLNRFTGPANAFNCGLKKRLFGVIEDPKRFLIYTYREDSGLEIDIALKKGANGLCFAAVVGRCKHNPRMGGGRLECKAARSGYILG
jgi:hypothetical protein